MTAYVRRCFPLVLGLLAVAALASPARAQSDGFSPYGNQGLPDYREFRTPITGNNPSLPGQARIESQRIGGGTRSNQFEAYSRSQRDDDGTDPSRSNGAGVPNTRSSRPSTTVEGQKYEEAVKRRNEAYAKARAEPDPAKRARLLRQLDADAMKHPLVSSAERPSATPLPKSAKGSQASSAPPPLPTTSAARNKRTTAPPPPFGRTAPLPARPGTSGTSPAPSTAPPLPTTRPATGTTPPTTAPAATPPGTQAPSTGSAPTTIPPPG